VFEDKSPVACRDIFSECANLLRSWRSAFRDGEIRFGEPQGNTVGGKASCVCGKAAVLRTDSSDTPCITSQWFLSYTESVVLECHQLSKFTRDSRDPILSLVLIRHFRNAGSIDTHKVRLNCRNTSLNAVKLFYFPCPAVIGISLKKIEQDILWPCF
jgi:hypothetical protein